jgi:hypothetical protein
VKNRTRNREKPKKTQKDDGQDYRMMTMAESTAARKKRKDKRREDKLEKEQSPDKQTETLLNTQELMEEMGKADDEEQARQNTSNNQYYILAEGDKEVEFEQETETEEESYQAMP